MSKTRDTAYTMNITTPSIQKSHRLVIGLVVMLVAIGLATLFVLDQFSKHTAKTVPMSPTPQGGAAIAIRSSSAVPNALLSFLPLGASDSLGMALKHATGNIGDKTLPAHFTVYMTKRHRYFVSAAVPVNVKVLERGGEIITGSAPGASSLQSGDLYVAGNMHGYGVQMNPKTHIAVFEFYLAPRDNTVWAINWNALGIISQNDSLN